MQQGPRIFLPDEFRDGRGLVRVRARESAPGPEERRALAGLLTSPTILAVAAAPSFHDQVRAYITHQEVLAGVLDGDVGRCLAEQPTGESVVELVRSLPFEPAMRFLASVQKALWQGRLEVAWQERLLRDLYGQSRVASVAEGLLRGQRRVIFTEQQLFALMRLAILHADERPASELTDEEHVAIRLALLYTPGTILQEAAPDDLMTDPPTGEEDSRWLRLFIGNGGLVATGRLENEIARGYRMYQTIATSQAARKLRHDYCPLDDWLLARYEMTFLELQGFGFATYVGSRSSDPYALPLAVPPEFFRTASFAERTDRGLDVIAADRGWFREQFQRTQEKKRYAAFEIHPFLRRPCLLQADSTAVVLSPRGIESWLGATGTYYRLLDVARERSPEDFERFLRFNGWLQERYVRHLVHVAHPTLHSRLSLRRVIPETTYKVSRQEMRSSDVAIEDGLNLVLIEVTAKRVTARTLVEADAITLTHDLQELVIDKMAQLGRVIRHTFQGRVWPNTDLSQLKNVWPIIVSADGLLQNPSLWSYVQHEGRHHLDIPGPASVHPLVLLDLEELEQLMGLISNGASLIGILKHKTSDQWVTRDFKAWHRNNPNRIGTAESTFIGAEFARAFAAIRRQVGLADPACGE